MEVDGGLLWTQQALAASWRRDGDRMGPELGRDRVGASDEYRCERQCGCERTCTCGPHRTRHIVDAPVARHSRHTVANDARGWPPRAPKTNTN
eukprot:15204343-Alexandrium_andersonii.AAC.1